MRDNLPQELDWAIRERKWRLDNELTCCQRIAELERRLKAERNHLTETENRIAELDEIIPRLEAEHGRSS